MKKHITTGLICTALLFVTSCKSFLEEKPYSFTSDLVAYNTAKDAEAALIGCYDLLNDDRWQSVNAIGLGDVGTDICEYSFGSLAEFRQILDYTYTPSHPRITQYWQGPYVLITRVNDLLANVPKVTMDETRKRQLLGEAYFLRALAYFNLVRAFGGVPLKITPTRSPEDGADLPRASVEEVYDQIYRDLAEAEERLPHRSLSSDDGRVYKMAAMVLTGKALLQQQKYQEAKVKLKECIDFATASGVYGLYDNYYKVFHYNFKNGLEHILSSQYNAADPSEHGGVTWTTAPAVTVPANLNSQGYTNANQYDGGNRSSGIFRVLLSFAVGVPAHYRSDLSFKLSNKFPSRDGLRQLDVNQGAPGSFKYWISESACYPSRFTSCMNFPILRYADVLLMYAEAINEAEKGPSPEAVSAVNAIRKRARTRFSARQNADDVGVLVAEEAQALPDLNLSDLNYATFKSAILYERAMELHMEGHRRWDLIRNGVFLEYVRNAYQGWTRTPAFANVDERHLLLPIPQRELNVVGDRWSQNPGY